VEANAASASGGRHHLMIIAVEKNSNFRFWAPLVAAFCITASYPVAMLVLFPGEQALQYLRNEVAWSFHAVFLIPIAVGLFASTFDLGRFFALEFRKRCAWVVIFFVPPILLFLAVIADREVVPTPDRVSPANGLQKVAMEVDQCLRDSTCKDADKYLSAVSQCRNKYETEFKTLRINAYLERSEVESLSKKFENTQAYFCALLEKTGGQLTEGSVISSVIFALKLVLIIFVWSFICYSLFLAVNYFFEIDQRTLYTLLGCYIIFVTWFPCQLYAEWYKWYGDLSHIKYWYGTFWAFLAIAFLMLLLFAAWAAVLIKKANLITTVATVHTTMVAAFAIVFGLKPDTLNSLFVIFQTLDNSTFLVLMFIVLLYIIVVISLVMGAGVHESVVHRRAVRTRRRSRKPK
jgi:hypothetical protein